MREDKFSEEKMDTILGQGAEMDGNISILGSARLDGKLKGTIKVQGTLIIGKTGIMEGDISAKNAIIGGQVKGKMHIEEKVVFESSAKFHGELTCKTIVIEEGVVFDGNCAMTQKGIQKEEKP
ncbi:MAG TPA: polymer-forming cytoskeletal protein [Candidatus Hydrothermia bacterium]|nr:polymer-forming cytoskeletal protein [Candidatus Hydrothermae bacterium]MDD3648666.1 polymer-forming cytoskeletal protein [Candidatus Hydrothermia bacterium]MDD5572247.1 polymer-forming cytoskeletal protein [Candidatus Hydrothermia bacterium]HOK22474.1 polymer-forming cytoskeletal protein [Candidatus Hydrothermia bacterium]HOL23181.1 polymer-forming cytoskeletal protein [Candidatus Hydrothermia bacterium]